MAPLIWTGIGVVVAVATLYVAMGIAMLVLRLRLDFVPDSPLTSVARRLLIVAPHPIDGVVIGAGQAMRALEHGGAVRVMMLTTGVERDGGRAEDEVRSAWKELGFGDEALIQGGFEGLRGLIDPAEVRAATEIVRETIEHFRPDRVVVPLYEGGHHQHDVAGLITARALAASGVGADLFEAPRYNFYYAWDATPRKLLALLAGFFGSTITPVLAEPIERQSIYVQPMSDSELETKRRMLSHLTSCDPAARATTGAVPDRLLPYAAHDYGRPPFDYERSFVARVEHWKRLPLLGRLVERWARRAVPRTRTIHPDPGYRITCLPVAELE